jgi:hypothetical protein
MLVPFLVPLFFLSAFQLLRYVDMLENKCYESCFHRGKAHGLSQEMYCDHCVRQDAWKKDFYVDKNGGPARMLREQGEVDERDTQ